jgi:peroxiredoxin
LTSEIALNAIAPDFELPDFRGNAFRLSSLRGAKYVLLVFNRGFS